MNARNTRQKQIILETLQETRLHPTISELYQQVLLKDDTIGQATVYRNVNRLVEEGLVRRISTPSDVDHYDGDCREHFHLLCKSCGKIKDVMDSDLTRYLSEMTEKHHIKIDHFQVLLEGICQECCERGNYEEI